MIKLLLKTIIQALSTIDYIVLITIGVVTVVALLENIALDIWRFVHDTVQMPGGYEIPPHTTTTTTRMAADTCITFVAS